VILDNRSVPLPPGNGATAGTFLVDGVWQGSWQIRDQTLRIQPFRTVVRFVAPKRSTTSSSTNRRSLAGSSVVADPPRHAAVPALRPMPSPTHLTSPGLPQRGDRGSLPQQMADLLR
jgi:hypothetical protein